MAKFNLIPLISVLLLLLLSFQNCGNINVNKDQSTSSGANGSDNSSGEGSQQQENLSLPEKCEREATLRATVADVNIPANKFLYNNYFTRTHVLGDDLLILADYSYGDQIITGQPVSGATGVVEVKYFSESVGVENIALPTIDGYSWNSRGGTAPNWCYVGDSIGNYKNEVYVLFFCTSATASPGFSNQIYKFSKLTKQFQPVYSSKTFIHGLNLNKADELMFIENLPFQSGQPLTYQTKKIIASNPPANIGSAFTTIQLQEFTILRPGIVETETGELVILTFKNNLYGRYKVLSSNFAAINWSQSAYYVSQAFDTKKIFYANNAAGAASPSTKIFEVDPNTFSENLKFSDGLYAYSFTPLIRNVYTRAGYDRSVSQFRTWISYDNGLNFTAVRGLNNQTNQSVITLSNKFYSMTVDQYSSGRIRASIYSLNCIGDD